MLGYISAIAVLVEQPLFRVLFYCFIHHVLFVFLGRLQLGNKKNTICQASRLYFEMYLYFGLFPETKA